MMGERRVMQEALFYGFSLERHVPDDHLLRKIDRFVDLSELRAHLGPYYSDVGTAFDRSRADDADADRRLLLRYSFRTSAVRRGTPQSGLSLVLPSWARRRRARSFDIFQEPPRPVSRERSASQTVRDGGRALHKEGIVGWEAFGVDASMIVADAHRRRGVAKVEDLDPTSSRAVAEYLSVLDDAAFGGATAVEPKVISPTDPAARYTASANSVAGVRLFRQLPHRSEACGDHGRRGDDGHSPGGSRAAKTMLDRTAEQFEVTPSRLVADGGYGSAEMIGWLVDERGIEPHVKLIDKSERTDGTFSAATSSSIQRATAMFALAAKS